MKRRLVIMAGIAILLSAGLVAAGCGSTGGTGSMNAGTYTAKSPSLNGPLEVEVTVSASAIQSVAVTSTVDSPGVRDWAIDIIPKRIVESQSVAVDVVSGVSITSRAIMAGVEDCLKQAGANIKGFSKPVKAAKPRNQDLAADVIIVGGGGAGLAAAVSATEAGASVILIEKMGFLGGNSVVSGGIYNTANPSRQDTTVVGAGVENLIADALKETPISEEHATLQKQVETEFDAFKRTNRTLFDSPSWHALQTWSGGDKVAMLNIVERMTGDALDGLNWLMGMGMEFYPGVIQGSGSLYPRTHRGLLPNGVGYIKAFTDTLETRGNYTQIMETTAKSLIVQNGRVVGVNAEGKAGNKVTLKANKGVVLVTGGFAGNVKLRQEYCEGEKWPDLGRRLTTTNVPGVTGDGIFMARDAGAKLVNMEQIQLLQVCNPQTGAIGGNAYPNYVEGYIFINKNGERFTNEGGRRDDISKAIMNQPEGYMYLVQSADSIPKPAETSTLDGRTVTYMLENKLSGWVSAPDLDGLAREMGVPAENLRKTVDTFNGYVGTRDRDEFGRALFTYRYTTGPWYAFPCKPAAHHTMGGVMIDEDCRTIREDGSILPGLYCAGEITGVVHGGNRLGGNAMVDFTVFGRIAGASAAAGK